MQYKLKSGNTLEIINDNSPRNPRTDFDNLTKMVCFHRRYSIGDTHDFHFNQFDSFDEMKQHLIKKENAVVILPLYMYDHSNITISTKPFSCRWDSGQLGFVYVSRETLMIEYSTKRITKKIKDKALEILLCEVETYDQYLSGDIYGFNVIDNENNVIDSCWGFYGSDPHKNGMIENINDMIID